MMVVIRPFEPEDASKFKTLNEAWITKYFQMEDSDQKMLDNPQGYILDKGGAIVIATLDGEAVGTCALIKKTDSRFELAKMAVDPAAQGKSIGYKLGLQIIETAKDFGAKVIFLETNSKLKPAISLYQKLGFKEVSSTCSPYVRCDLQMELPLTFDS